MVLFARLNICTKKKKKLLKIKEVFTKAERWKWLNCIGEMFITGNGLQCEAASLLRKRHSDAHATGNSWVLTVQLVSAIKASTTFPMCSLRLRSATPRGISISAICDRQRRGVLAGAPHSHRVPALCACYFSLYLRSAPRPPS